MAAVDGLVGEVGVEADQVDRGGGHVVFEFDFLQPCACREAHPCRGSLARLCSCLIFAGEAAQACFRRMRAVFKSVTRAVGRSTMERWVQTRRHELLDRTLIWNQAHLLHALCEFGRFYNVHRPHQGTANARPLHRLPAPLTDPDHIVHLDVRRHDRLGGILHDYRRAA